MNVPTERRDVIARLVEDLWDSEDEFDQFFATVTSAEELHIFAYHFNMGTGVGELRKVVRHPLCDRGTLLLIYWRLTPGWFHSDTGHTGMMLGADSRDLFQEIERRYLAGEFGSSVVAFDPRRFRGGDLVAGNEQYGGLPRVPPTMFEPAPGSPVRPLWGAGA